MRVSDRVVRQLQVLIRVHLAARPEAAIAILVGGEILDDRLRERAVRVRGIGIGRVPAYREMAIRPGTAIHQETVEGGVGRVALELPHLRSTWPRGLADVRT